MDEILTQNKLSWNAIADNWPGGTSLPIYGCLCPTEDELRLFPDLNGKKVLEVGCGGGQSLKWCGDRGTSELWGLDISEHQLEHAAKHLKENGYDAKLICSPMEQNLGLPQRYFDVVYSIYAIGWTVDLETTFSLISSYLKSGSVFIFSWDHPFLHCVEAKNEQLIFSVSYHESEPFTFSRSGAGKGVGRSPVEFEEGGNPLTLYNHRLSDYINALASSGFAVERIIEETDKDTLERSSDFSSEYYAPCKAKHFPLSLIVKARKL